MIGEINSPDATVLVLPLQFIEPLESIFQGIQMSRKLALITL